MSSNTRTTGSWVASRSRNRRHPANSSARSNPGEVTPSSAPEPGLDVLALLSLHDPPLQVRPRACAAASARRGILRDPEPLAHHLRQRPIGDAVAVRQTAAGVPEELLRQPVDVVGELAPQPPLPDPGLAADRDQPRRRHARSSGPAAPSSAAVRRRGRRTGPPGGLRGRARRAPATTLTARHSRSGSTLPFTVCSPASWNRHRGLSHADGSPRRPGHSLARRPTAPVRPCSPGRRRRSLPPGCPRRPPGRLRPRPAPADSGAPTSAAEDAHRIDDLQRRPDGPLGVILLRERAPQTAITASPMNFSTVPP